MSIAMAVLTVAGIAMVVLGLMGLLGKLRRNHFAGIRTRFTMASDINWYRTHRAGAAFMIFGGVAVMMAGIAFLPFSFAGMLSDAAALAVCIVLAVILVSCALASAIYGIRSAKRQLAANSLEPPLYRSDHGA